MKEDISPSMLAFDYGKLAIEINVGIVVPQFGITSSI